MWPSLSLTCLVGILFAAPLSGERTGPDVTPWGDLPSGDYVVFATLKPGTDAKSSDRIDLALEQSAQGEEWRISFSPGSVKIQQISSGRVQSRASLSSVWPKKQDVSIAWVRQREDVYLVVDQRTLWQSHSGWGLGGTVGTGIQGTGAVLDGMRIQPAGEVVFADDFMRTEESPSPWEVRSGSWGVTQADDPVRSANAFRYSGITEDEAGMSVTGYPFWNGVEVRVSACCETGRGLGLACHVSGQSFFLLRWMSTGIELVSVVQGQEKVCLRREAPFKTGVWTRLGLRTSVGHLTAFVDGENVFSLEDERLSGGGIGLWVPANTRAVFDDVKVSGTCESEWSFSEGWGGWESVASEWEWTDPGGRSVPGPGNRSTPQSLSEGAQITYRGVWTGGGAAMVGWASEQGGMTLSLPTGTGRFELRCDPETQCLSWDWRHGEQVETLTSRQISWDPGRSHVLRVIWEDEEVSGFFDDQGPLKIIGTGTLDGQPQIRAGGPGLRLLSTSLKPEDSREEDEVQLTKQFTLEDTMKTWATSTGRWTLDASQKTYWHLSDFPGNATATVLSKSWPQGSEQCTLLLGCPARSVDQGVQLQIQGQGDRVGLAFAKAGEKKTETSVSLEDFQKLGLLEVHKIGDAYAAVAGGLRLDWSDPDPVEGDQVGLQCTSEAVGPAIVDVRSRNVKDYTFFEAPVDWIPAAGEWVVSNRWMCDPRWSWFTGYSDDMALLWNKRVLPEDFTFECFAGFKMQYRTQPFYDRCSDMNFAICADGQNVSSGYNVLIGGYENTGVFLMRQGEKVAENREFHLPSYRYQAQETMTLHRRWFAVKIRKRGGHIQVFMDDQAILEYQDPEPLKGSYLGMWTWNAGYMYARTSITGRKIGATKACAPSLTGSSLEERVIPSDKIRILSETHPAFFSDFESGLDGWEPYPQDGSVHLERTEGGAGQGRASLRVENLSCGGWFGARWPLPSVPVSPGLTVDFLYRISPQAQVNLLFLVNGVYYEVLFTGPLSPVERARPLGMLEDIQADGRWHSAHFDVGEALCHGRSPEEPLVLQEVLLAHPCTGIMDQAGFKGNLAGAWYGLDRVRLRAPVAGRTFSASIVGLEGQDDPIEIVLKQGRRSKSTSIVRGQGLLKWEDLAPGAWTLEARAEDSSLFQPARLDFRVDDAPPRLTVASPTGAYAQGLISIRATDDGALAPDQGKVRLEMKCGDSETWNPDWDWDPVSGELSVWVNGLAQASSPRGPLKLRVEGIEDAAGNVARAQEFSWRLALQEDREPPSAPRLRLQVPALMDESFESGVGAWTPRYGTELLQDPQSGTDGQCSLKVWKPGIAGGIGCTILDRPFDAGKYPRISFDYSLIRGVLTDFLVVKDGDPKNIVFTDNDDPVGALGSVQDVVTDGTWHHAEIPLADLLRKQEPLARSLIVDKVYMDDYAWQANGKGQFYRLDHFQILPVVSTRVQDGFSVLCQAYDPSGIQGYSWEVDTMSQTLPDEVAEQEKPDVLLHALGSGDRMFHVRAVDRQGNWGPASHLRLCVDDDPPVWGDPSPAEGSPAAPNRLAVGLKDERSGIDLSSLQMDVGGIRFTSENAGISYESSQGILSWDLSKVSEAFAGFEDGHRVDVVARSMDCAGNDPGEKRWSFVLNRAVDRDPPGLPRIVSSSHPCLTRIDFDKDLLTCSLRDAETQTKISRDTDVPSPGGASLKVEALLTGSDLRCQVFGDKFDLDRYPILSLDYKVAPGVTVDLILDVNARWYSVKLTDTDPSYPVIGDLGAVADGQWHHVRLHLKSALMAAGAKGDRFICEAIGFADTGQSANPVGSCLWLDNISLLGDGGLQASLTWTPVPDMGGISGYGLILDQTPITTPGESDLKTETLFQSAPLTAGTWTLHVNAKDRAGNWGPTVHYVFEVL